MKTETLSRDSHHCNFCDCPDFEMKDRIDLRWKIALIYTLFF